MSDPKANGGIDLADFTSDKAGTAVLELRHPKTGDVIRHEDGRPYTVTLLSNQSDEFLAVARQQEDRRRAAMLRTRQLVSTVATEKDAVELLVAVTKSWDIKFGDDKSSAPKPENYRACYTKVGWLRQQVDEFVGNVANFFQGR